MTEETPQTAEVASHPPRDQRRVTGGLRARDLMNVAIFAVIYLIVQFAINMLGFLNPAVMLIAVLVSVIVCGIPFMLFLTRVKRPGMVLLFGLLIGGLFALTGVGWINLVFTLALSLIAEVILWFGQYRSRWAEIWAYTVFSLWAIAPFLPLLIDREAFLASPAIGGTGPEYIEEFDRLVTTQVLWGYNVATLVCGFLGGLLGVAMLKKHFVRAGLA